MEQNHMRAIIKPSIVHMEEQMTEQKKGLDAYKLKLIALCFMILDHLHTHLWFSQYCPQWSSVVTRFVAPLFLYLMVEGFYHTRNRKKYMSRLFLAALIMMCGNVIINLSFHHVNSYTGKYSYFSLTGPNNIFLTLALLFALIWCLENIKLRKNILLNVFLSVLIAALCIFAEGGLYLLPVVFFVWLFRGKKAGQCIGIGIYCLILLILALISFTGDSSLYSYLCFDCEWAMALVIPFILLYNGERGKNTAFSKYMFYIIYPVHIWILVILNFIFG
jgi:hypothetical protein